MQVQAVNGLARCLKTEGIGWVTTFPTSPVNNALGEEGVPILMMGEERYAVAVADAFSRLTGGQRIGVCTVMGGVNAAGIQMASGAIAQAWEDSSPVLIITEGLSRGASTSTHYSVVEAFRPITKWVGRVETAEQIPSFVRRAFTLLRSGRPGPVLLVVPRDLGAYDEALHPYHPVPTWRSGPNPADVRSAVQAILQARRPVIWAGEGVFYADATDELRQFAELAQAPVMTTLKGKSSFPEHHPLSLGLRGALVEQFLHSSDLVFAIGSSLFPGRYTHAIPDANNKTIVQCTIDAIDLNRSYETAIALVGDARLALQALIEELSSRTEGAQLPRPGLVEEIRAGRAAHQAKFRPYMESEALPINPYRVIGDLASVLDPECSFITGDSGYTRDQLSTVYSAHIPRGYFGWGNVSSLGYGLAGAVAAKLAFPERQCVNLTGDAGVAYMMGNFESVARNRIGITTVHINNGGYSGYGPGFWGAGHSPYTWQVSDHTVARMSDLASAVGYSAERVIDPAEIIPALKRAFAENAQGRPAYIEVICSQHPIDGGWLRAGQAGH